MTDIKQAVLSICLVAVAAGLFKMLIPDNKFKTHISFLISCIFAVCVISAVSNVQLEEMSFAVQSANVIDFSEKLSENAADTAAAAVKAQVEKLLLSENLSCDKVNVTAHIDDEMCISISEIELVFSSGRSESYADRAAAVVQKEVGDSIEVKAEVIEEQD